MKPQNAESHKRKGWVPLSTFAFVDAVPEKIKYRDNLLPFAGSDDMLTIPWGVYGTTSLNAASFYASHFAQREEKVMLTLTIYYFIENFSEATSQLPQSLDQCNGFMHMGRLGSKLRDSLHLEFGAMLEAERTPRQMESIRRMSWGEMILSEPWVVRQYLKKSRNLHLIVHPVGQLFDTAARESIQVGSFKLHKDRIMAVEARYFPNVAVSV